LKKLKWLFVVYTLLFISCQAQNERKVWYENLESAIEIAKEENKTVFINFTGSDWCKYCIKLDQEVLSQNEFKKFAQENLILVKLDFPRKIKQSQETIDYNRNLMNKYRVPGFPSIILLNGDGNQIGSTGYLPGGPQNYVKHLKEIIF
jgi:protein disulfide-isomerase